MNGYEAINFTYFNPCHSIFKTSRNDRERVTVYMCCNKDNCDAYKRGKCLMLNGLWSHTCPYGKIERREGYTKAARNCGELIRKYKNQYGDVSYALKELRFVCNIGDYVFLNLPHLVNYDNPIRDRSFFIGEDTIKKENFTPEFVDELIRYVPRDFFGNPIKRYREENVPQFCSQLKRYMPDMYEAAKAICPAIENLVANIDYVGKYAKVTTLLPGKVQIGTNIVDWDGKFIKGNGNMNILWELKDGEEIVIIPKDNTYVKIYDNATVTEDTELRDD